MKLEEIQQDIADTQQEINQIQRKMGMCIAAWKQDIEERQAFIVKLQGLINQGKYET